MIEKTSHEIEMSKDDQSIYDQHKKKAEPEILDLDESEAEAMMREDSGMSIEEADEDGYVDSGVEEDAGLDDMAEEFDDEVDDSDITNLGEEE